MYVICPGFRRGLTFGHIFEVLVSLTEICIGFVLNLTKNVLIFSLEVVFV